MKHFSHFKLLHFAFFKLSYNRLLTHYYGLYRSVNNKRIRHFLESLEKMELHVVG